MSVWTREHELEDLALNEEEVRRLMSRRFHKMFPDDGKCARHLYPKHLEFFRVGMSYRERALMAANRVGKTTAGAFEATCHLTGLYPPWWEGKRFAGPVDAWAAGKTNETTRDIIQATMCGPVQAGSGGQARSFAGTGMIPGDDLGQVSWRQGVTDLADTIRVKHRNPDGEFDGWSSIGLKSYLQGRGSFEGTAKHFVWLDEEPPEDIYGECLIRTATTNGIVFATFTPLEGLTAVALSFLPAEQRPDF